MPKTCAGRSRAALLRGLGEEAADIHTLIHRFCALGTCRQSRECESRDVHRPEARTVQGMSREAGWGRRNGWNLDEQWTEGHRGRNHQTAG